MNTPLKGMLFVCASIIASITYAGEVRRDTHENLNATLWMQTSAEYQMLTRGAYKNAISTVKKALADPSWTAATEQFGKDFWGLPPAIIVDIDETVLNNSKPQASIVKRKTVYDKTDAEWNKWVHSKSAPAIPGAREFLTWAASPEVGATIFYVTNRSKDLEADTLENLKLLGFPVAKNIDVILARGEYGSTSSDKTSRRQVVAEKYRILLMAGDDMGDFIVSQGTPEERVKNATAYEQFWGERWVILPNPTYGSWERSLYSGAEKDEDVLKAKFEKLKTFE